MPPQVRSVGKPPEIAHGAAAAQHLFGTPGPNPRAAFALWLAAKADQTFAHSFADCRLLLVSFFIHLWW
jgi:hypothetical protein